MSRLILWTILLYILGRIAWRVLKSIFESMGYQPPGAAKGVGLVRDPVCGTFVVPTKALTAGSGANTRYFCSEKCRAAYAAKS